MSARVSWLLDTNVVSETMRPAPEPRVVYCIDRLAPFGIGLSSVTAWEAFNGIGLLEPGRRREDLARRFQRLLDDLFQGRVLPWTIDDARSCARIMETRRREGRPLDGSLPDAMLAGAALSRKIGIVTRNVNDFRNVGVKIVDPWTADSATGPLRRSRTNGG